MNFIKSRPLFLLLALTLLTTLLFWSVFYFNLPRVLGFPSVSMQTLFANYDGQNYLIISKCGYNPSCIRSRFAQPLPLEYFPAHFPGYPLLISLLSLFFSAPWAMLFVTLIGSLLLTYYFYLLIKDITDDKTAFWLSLILLFFPARLFVLRLIGAPESLFIFACLASIYYFQKKRFVVSALLALLAQTLKSPGVLLFVTYAFYFLINKKINKSYFWYLLAPFSLLFIFGLYYFQTGDFFAYFHSGDNIHLSLFPYGVFLSFRSWIGTIWLEDIIYLLAFAFFGLNFLYQRFKRDPLFLFPAIYLFFVIFVSHRDISRYLSPIFPFLLLGFSGLTKLPRFKLIFFLLIPAVVLYAINFIIGNTAPIENWFQYL
ncbi:MAG: hypothetical protein WCV93_04685 [Candidatus Shapirobacteria bacterium]